MIDSRSPSDNDKSPVLRLALAALALIAVGLFLTMQDGSWANPPAAHTSQSR